MIARKKLIKLPLTEKLYIIKECEEESPSIVAKRHKVTRQAVNYILNKENDLLTEKSEPFDLKRTRLSNQTILTAIADLVIDFILKCNSKQIPVDGPIVKAFADKQIETNNVTDFKASLPWIYKLMKRKGITSQLINGESCSVDRNEVSKWKIKIKEITEKYTKEQIFNVDEAAVFWKQIRELSVQ